jgi:hypothetical protein
VSAQTVWPAEGLAPKTVFAKAPEPAFTMTLPYDWVRTYEFTPAVTPLVSDLTQPAPQYPASLAAAENGTWPVTVA